MQQSLADMKIIYKLASTKPKSRGQNADIRI